MRTCDYSESPGYDPTGEYAEPCLRPSVGSCFECGDDVCLGHGKLCACGQILCESCRLAHQASCAEHKLETFKRHAAPEHRATYARQDGANLNRGEI